MKIWRDPPNRSVRRFTRSPFGPMVLSSDGHSIRATDPNGRACTVEGVDFGAVSRDDFFELLREGIDVRIDGVVVARVVQLERKLARRSRIVRLDAIENGPIVRGAFFRLRGWNNVTLETNERPLIRPPRFVPHGLSGTLVVADDVSAELVLVYALLATAHHFRQSLSWP